MDAHTALLTCQRTPPRRARTSPLTCAHVPNNATAPLRAKAPAPATLDTPMLYCAARPLSGLRSSNASGVERPNGRYWSGYARRGLTATGTCHVRKCTGRISNTSRKKLAYDTLAGSRLGTCTHVRTSCARDVQLRCRRPHVHPPLADDHHVTRRPRSQTWG